MDRMVVGNHLESIINEMQFRCGSKAASGWHTEFKALTKNLTPLEGCILADAFCKTPWNIGSPKILAILQDLGILSAKEFILRLDDMEKAKLICNDFLETEFDLITNIFVATHYDKNNADKLNILMDECLSSLFQYILSHPSFSGLAYLRSFTRSSLPVGLSRNVLQKHVQTVLGLHQSEISEAFKNFSNWIDEGFHGHSFICDFLSIAEYFEGLIVNQLLKLSTAAHFKNWKFFVIMMQTIAMKGNYESLRVLNTFLKTRLRRIAQCPSQIDILLHLLLTARTITVNTKSDKKKSLDAYAEWYRQNIADMKFVMSIEEFANVLQALQQCVDYEKETDYLEVHSKISISPPLHFGKVVSAYKAKCKSQLALIRNGIKPKECILIEDSN